MLRFLQRVQQVTIRIPIGLYGLWLRADKYG